MPASDRLDPSRSGSRYVRPQWTRLTAGNAALVAAGLVALESLWAGGLTTAFLAAVAVVVALESAILFVLLAVVDERSTGTRPGAISLATWVTTGRGGAVAILAGFAVTSPSPSGAIAWAPAALFVAAAALDAVDGAIARATDSVTALGSRLDVETDGLVVLVGTVVAVGDGALPIAFLAVACARYLFVAGRWWRRRTGRRVLELPRNRFRGPLGALAMLAVWLALLPAVGDSVSRAFAYMVAVPFLANFCWDWLAVTGRVRSDVGS